MTSITLNNLTKIFGEEIAVKSFDLRIDDGEFLVLVGPSGCGKTTTLRMIAGLEKTSAGTIHFDQEEVTEYPPKERNVGMVFQSYALYPHMTIEENLSFGLRLKGEDRVEIRQKVEDTANLLGIEDHLSKKPKQLSGGQRQRVALGRAIIRNPNCFLFDEPLSNLDAKLRVQMRGEIQRLQNQTNITAIYVTHDQTEAMSMADRIVIMDKGLIQQVGSPQEVYTEPVNKFVASFIGSPEMNIIEGTLENNGEKWSVNTEMGSLEINPTQFNLDEKTGNKVHLGMRPEHLEVELNLDKTKFHVTIDVFEPLGADTFLYSQMGENQFGVRVEGIFDQKLVEKNKNKIGLIIKPENVYLFDFETEQSLR
ncbi:MAG: ABC transporter ATP-binding protein [Candidatus Kariarchaeaceae archaeon]|jgi:multiple sugar transport system ATP-binding protein